MNLYYALGGGLGHITRARAFLHTLGLEHNTLILSSCPFLPDERITGPVQTIRVDDFYNRNIPDLQFFLQHTLDKYSIETLFFDAFPGGILGEFVGFNFPETIEINYIARMLKWGAYKVYLENAYSTQFTKTYVLEPLQLEHQEFVNKYSKIQLDIRLNYPESNLSAEDESKFRLIIGEKQPFWLIPHSGSEDEVLELVNYADEMRRVEKRDVNLILISPQSLSFPQISNLTVFNIHPASVLFEPAERIITACGFNSMQQAQGFRNKHVFIPFERRFDDQFERARRFRLSQHF